MSAGARQVPKEEECRRRLFGWWVWLLIALVLGGTGVGSYAGAGGFSASSANAGSSASPAVAAGGAKGPIPPTPKITSEPPNPTTATNATFKYSDNLPAVTFYCSLDSSNYSSCGKLVSLPTTGSITYKNLSIAAHCFFVEAVLAILKSTPASYCWTVDALPFTINGGLTLPLYPGMTESVDLSIYNPNAGPMTIPAQPPAATNNVSVLISLNRSSPTYTGASIAQRATWATCAVSANFALTQELNLPITVPGGATVSLSEHTTEYSSGMPMADWPVITMYDGDVGPTSHTNQDSCENAPLLFTWSAFGSGT